MIQNVDDSNIFNLETRSNTLLFGTALGIDLWFIEFSIGPFLMYHDTKVNLRTCKRWLGNIKYSSNANQLPSDCKLYPDEVINFKIARTSEVLPDPDSPTIPNVSF